MLFLLLALFVFFEGCTASTRVPAPGVDAAADAGIDATDASENTVIADGVTRDAGSEIYDGPLDDALPCPQQGITNPCTTPPEVVYGCRCVHLHCFNGRWVLAPDSPGPCP